MARFRRRSTRGYLGRKRNSERVIRGGNSVLAASSQQVAYTYIAKEACVVRSIKLDTGATNINAVLIPYVLVRVQEGYNANTIVYPALTDDLYNPTNEVLISGILTDNAVEDHKSNAIGRKLKAGDRMALIFLNGSSGGEASVSFGINFTVLT